jgi:hypothetical protein
MTGFFTSTIDTSFLAWSSGLSSSAGRTILMRHGRIAGLAFQRAHFVVRASAERELARSAVGCGEGPGLVVDAGREADGPPGPEAGIGCAEHCAVPIVTRRAG